MPIDPLDFAKFARTLESDICKRLGHSWRFVLPLQTRDADRTALCACAICSVPQCWIKIPEEGYQRLLQDAAAGKLTPRQ